jgi:hypothetical protein
MAGEVNVSGNLTINKRDSSTTQTQPLISKTYQGNLRADMAGAKGPTPGAINVPVMGSGGVQVDFSALTTPGWCWVEHQGRADGSASEDGDHVMMGMYDPVTDKFWPMLEWVPGLRLPLLLSRHIQQTFLGPGTGSAGFGEAARMMLIAYPVAQTMSVEAFEV